MPVAVAGCFGSTRKKDMKQTVEEAAREHQTHFEICDVNGKRVYITCYDLEKKPFVSTNGEK